MTNFSLPPEEDPNNPVIEPKVIVRPSGHPLVQDSLNNPEVSYVQDRQKGDLWTSLMTTFSLPPEEDPNNPVIEPMVKAFALNKMVDLFRN